MSQIELTLTRAVDQSGTAPLTDVHRQIEARREEVLNAMGLFQRLATRRELSSADREQIKALNKIILNGELEIAVYSNALQVDESKRHAFLDHVQSRVRTSELIIRCEIAFQNRLDELFQIDDEQCDYQDHARVESIRRRVVDGVITQREADEKIQRLKIRRSGKTTNLIDSIDRERKRYQEMLLGTYEALAREFKA